MRTLFLSPPSFEGFDGGAGSRYQARREVTSFWYPTWLAQPAALTPNSRLLDCPPHNIGVRQCLEEARQFDHVIINTSTPKTRHHRGFHRRSRGRAAGGNLEGLRRH
jgi:hypothetical protein